MRENERESVSKRERKKWEREIGERERGGVKDNERDMEMVYAYLWI